MTSMIWVVLLALGGAAESPPLRSESAQTAPTCPQATERGRGLVVGFVTSGSEQQVRARYGMHDVAEMEIRVLTDAEGDAVACGRLRAELEQRARDVGGSLDGSLPEFYQAGAYYFAVLPLPPSTCRDTPESVCIDLRRQGLTVYDRSFNLVAPVTV